MRATRPGVSMSRHSRKVELPVWLSYGLGGRKSTSSAAEQLGCPRYVWWSNRFRGRTQSGGKRERGPEVQAAGRGWLCGGRGLAEAARARPARRGSGMLTALAAVALAWCEPRPAEAMRIAANALGTDTDTIATMAGALLGLTADLGPPVEVLDADLFRSEARRLAQIAAGENPPSHAYPDLLHGSHRGPEPTRWRRPRMASLWSSVSVRAKGCMGNQRWAGVDSTGSG